MDPRLRTVLFVVAFHRCQAEKWHSTRLTRQLETINVFAENHFYSEVHVIMLGDMVDLDRVKLLNIVRTLHDSKVVGSTDLGQARRIISEDALNILLVSSEKDIHHFADFIGPPGFKWFICVNNGSVDTVRAALTSIDLSLTSSVYLTLVSKNVIFNLITIPMHQKGLPRF